MNDLFSSSGSNRHEYRLPDAALVLYEFFFPKNIADNYYQSLFTDIKWQQEEITVFNKKHLTPRLTAWYGEADYRYSGVMHHPHPWNDVLLKIKQKIDEASGVVFNSVLLNLYRNGRDGMGWHRDNEKELGINPVIASVSFGETRIFKLRHKFDKTIPQVAIPLAHGSFLWMAGTTQHYWEHQVAKTAKAVDQRINLTFRVIK